MHNATCKQSIERRDGIDLCSAQPFVFGDWQVWKDTGLPLALGDGTAASNMGGANGKVPPPKTQQQIKRANLHQHAVQCTKQCLEVVYIDTEGTFRPERIRQIAEGKGVSAEAGTRDPLRCSLS